jgi:hypothetical protein
MNVKAKLSCFCYPGSLWELILKGSDKRGVGKVANEKYMPWTVVVNVFLLLIWPPLKNHISVSAHSSQIIRR